MEVVGRKAFNGCGSLAMANLLAVMATVFNTLKQHHVDLRAWLFNYLIACSFAGGQAPVNAGDFLPWNTNSHHLSTPSKPQNPKTRHRSRSPPNIHAP